MHSETGITRAKARIPVRMNWLDMLVIGAWTGVNSISSPPIGKIHCLKQMLQANLIAQKLKLSVGWTLGHALNLSLHLWLSSMSTSTTPTLIISTWVLVLSSRCNWLSNQQTLKVISNTWRRLKASRGQWRLKPNPQKTRWLNSSSARWTSTDLANSKTSSYVFSFTSLNMAVLGKVAGFGKQSHANSSTAQLLSLIRKRRWHQELCPWWSSTDLLYHFVSNPF